MSINHIEATKFFDEVRAHFGRQTQAGNPIELVIKTKRRSDGAILIGYFDANNPHARPLLLMMNKTGTGVNWENLIGSGVIFQVVNQALLAFSRQKEEWPLKKYNFTTNEVLDFLINFMRQVSSYLR